MIPDYWADEALSIVGNFLERNGINIVENDDGDTELYYKEELIITFDNIYSCLDYIFDNLVSINHDSR